MSQHGPHALGQGSGWQATGFMGHSGSPVVCSARCASSTAMGSAKALASACRRLSSSCSAASAAGGSVVASRLRGIRPDKGR